MKYSIQTKHGKLVIKAKNKEDCLRKLHYPITKDNLKLLTKIKNNAILKNKR